VAVRHKILHYSSLFSAATVQPGTHHGSHSPWRVRESALGEDRDGSCVNPLATKQRFEPEPSLQILRQYPCQGLSQPLESRNFARPVVNDCDDEHEWPWYGCRGVEDVAEGHVSLHHVHAAHEWLASCKQVLDAGGVCRVWMPAARGSLHMHVDLPNAIHTAAQG
jgi:hypothetical protein